MDGENRVADYFIVSGISDKFQHNTESKPFIKSELPITDVTVIFKGLGERCPEGYECIETTPGGHVADLNNGNFKSPNIHICYRRGDDKPPLIEVGVFHEGKDRVLPDVKIVSETPYGRRASTGTGSKSGTFITFRRAKSRRPYNQLVVVDLCVIFNNKSEHAPHAFYAIKKNLNKSYYGMIGSEVFLCYKKTFLSPPSICYTPQIISRFPLQDYANFPLPDTVPLFCLPAGANIELRPSNIQPPRPVSTTFVLTSNSAQKIYGSALTFYESFDQSLLNSDQKARLGIANTDDEECKSKANDTSSHHQNRLLFDTFSIKSICILSRWPFFDCFENYLSFLHKLVFNPSYSSKSNTSLEHYISHFLLDVSFPTPQRPTVLVQLMSGADETITISQPSSKLPLPLTGASFIELLSSLGVDNTMNVLLFGLCEQKILLHSLNTWLLTGVAEAITAILFPFHWQCPYVPLCPLSLHGIINAPMPFIVGIDSRCFDTFTPPEDVICIDLDTQSVYLSESKKCLNSRILPKRASRVLRSSLNKIYQKWIRISQAIGANQSPQHGHREDNHRLLQKRLELEIQEAFLRFMATILRGFRSYLLPITRAPTVGATDPTSLFNFEGFLSSRDRSYSQFYDLITRTQMFTNYIEERSFVSDKDTSLAFFDDCEEKLISSDDIFSDKPIKLFDKDDGSIPTDRSVYIFAPEQSPSVATRQNSGDSNELSTSVQQRITKDNSRQKCKFGPLNPALFHRHPQTTSLRRLNRAINGPNVSSNYNHVSQSFDQILNTGYKASDVSFSISRRTKQEIKACQKMAKRSTDSPIDWSKYLVSCCYCLWFSTLPSYILYCKAHSEKSVTDSTVGNEGTKSTARILRYAFTTIVRMQKLELITEEICFRILTLLCGYHGQPALAVRVFFEMKKAGIKPNAVTYGYYNKAVLESRWPDHSSKPTTVLWTKIRNVISGIALFKTHGRLRQERNKRGMDLIGDPNFFSYRSVDVVDRAINTSMNGSIKEQKQTSKRTKKLERGPLHNSINAHRRSLVNRSFSTYQKSTLNMGKASDGSSVDLQSFGDYYNKTAIQKSYSMHLRDDVSPEHGSLTHTKSSSLDDDDDDEEDEDEEEVEVGQKEDEEPNMIQDEGGVQSPTSRIKMATSLELFQNLIERYQLLNNLGDCNRSLMNNIDLADTTAGLLFSTDPENCSRSARSASQSGIQNEGVYNLSQTGTCTHQTNIRDDLIPIESDLVEAAQVNHNHLSPNAALLNAGSFGEDARILRKLNSKEQQPNSVNNSRVIGGEDCDVSTSSDARNTDIMSESNSEPSEDNPSNEGDSSSLRNITSTPNFKLASLINDASNLQWSKWTSSQNSKNVYKGIKSAATGIVSQLQEIKSSFSISNSTTPSKLLISAQHKSITTREMLSQWANYFTYQPSRTYDGDSDTSSEGSNDLLRLSNEEDVEPSSTEASDFRHCYKLFDTLEKHYNNSNSKEDLIDHLSPNQEVDQNEIAIEIRMTTCSRCNVCHSLLYDEEIMERWSHNESNLNTKCVYCRAKIVPLMSIEVDDFRFKDTSVQQNNTNREEYSECSTREKNSAITADLVDLDSSNSESDQVSGSSREQQLTSTKRNSQSNNCIQQNFTVPYLSPIVLRKELESVFESSGDNCPSSSQFIDEHPIIFWNLLWYFSRINVPTHLALLCLSSKSILNGKELSEKAKFMNRVIVKTLWDNDKLYAQVGKPLYRLMERGDPSLQVQAILCDDMHFTRSFLDRVINFIRNNQLQKAMIMVLNARLKSSNRFSFDKNRHNLYRDLIFLIKICFGPGRLFMDNFEREYKKAFEGLNFQQVALNRFDRPPTIGSLFCRKCFKEMSLIKRG